MKTKSVYSVHFCNLRVFGVFVDLASLSSGFLVVIMDLLENRAIPLLASCTQDVELERGEEKRAWS